VVAHFAPSFGALRVPKKNEGECIRCMLEMNVEITNDEKFARKRECYFKNEINEDIRDKLFENMVVFIK
jgi:hypothetical protein